MAEQTKTNADSAMLTELQDMLSTGAKAVSSSATGIEESIGRAMGAVKTGTEAESARIESVFDREIDFARGQAQSQITTSLEGRAGFGTQIVALRNLVESTDKQLNDLEQRKQELILQNNAAGAAKISELEMQALQYRQQAQQQVFDNLLSVSAFGLSAEQFREGQRQFGEEMAFKRQTQSFAERQAMGSVALEFGIDIQEGDDIDSVVNRAVGTGQISERRALELEKIRADIANSKAQAARAMRADASEQPFDETTTEILANAFRQGQTDFLSGLKTNEQLSAVYSAIAEKVEKDRENLRKIAEESTSESIQVISRVLLFKNGRSTR